MHLILFSTGAYLGNLWKKRRMLYGMVWGGVGCIYLIMDNSRGRWLSTYSS